MAKILVIDDENMLREEIVEWLTLEGYDAIGAADGRLGLELARKHMPDLIVSDITMPYLDGFGVLLELNSDPITAGIPFIFVTARAAHEDIRRGMTLGADDYITKPFTRLELLNAIDTRLQKKLIQAQDYQDEINYWQQAFEQEHIQRLLKAKMVGMFSHDFRNPLSVIRSSVDLIRNYGERLNETRKDEHWNKIEGSVNQLVQMLDDMLMVAKLEGEYLDYDPQKIDVSSLVGQIVDDFKSVHIDSHQLTFLSNLSGEYELDPKLLRNAISNLLSNAIKYSPSGSEVLVTLSDMSSHFALAVQDKGFGIPEDDLKHLFEPFHRAGNVKSITGTGLGLSIVKRCVELQGGSLRVESEVDKGSTFFVMIPTNNNHA